jgi:hypothetical protein
LADFGSRSWRNNNPGNLGYGPFAIAHGAIGRDGRFAIFPSEAVGTDAQRYKLFNDPAYKDLTLTEAIPKWAPPSENDVPAYMRAVGGSPTDKPLGEYSPAEQDALLQSMRTHEGWHPGDGGTQVAGGFQPMVGNLSDIPGGNAALATPRPAGFGFGNISGQVSDIGAPRALPGSMTPGPSPTGAPWVPPLPPPRLTGPASTSSWGPSQSDQPALHYPINSETGPGDVGQMVPRPGGRGDIVSRTLPYAIGDMPKDKALDPNMPVVTPAGPQADEIESFGAENEPYRNYSGGTGFRNISGQASDLPPSQQTMLAGALAQGQPQPTPPIDPALLALALNGGAANVGGADFGGGLGFGS